jgi:tetratricopeptide (TPR) repeat protein
MMNARTDAYPVPRRLTLAVGALLLSWVAWRVFTLGMAEHYSRDSPDTALAWREGHAEALLQGLDREALAPHVSASQSEGARAAIRSAPLDGRGYRYLARQVELGGDLPDAMSLYSIASTRGPRDLPTLGRLVQYELKRRNYAQALAHIDQILRVEPELSKRLDPVLTALVAQDPAEVANVLLKFPPWRSGFLFRLIAKSPESAALPRLIDRLRRSPQGLTSDELSAWLNRLIKRRQWSSAYLSWVESLSPTASKRIGNVYNGSFELEPSQMGFDWRFGTVPGARVSRTQVTGSDGQYALRVEFEDRRVPFRHVRQLLALSPGQYRLQGRDRTDDLRGERGLVWTLTCAETGQAIAETDPTRGRHDWRSFELDFVVPAEKCGGQWLTLRVPARIPAEQRVGGVAWFDDLSIRATPP